MAMSRLVEVLVQHPPMARDLPGFDAADVPGEPASLFVEWLLGAIEAGVPDAQVVTLSTVDGDGLPDARALVLRDVDVDRAGWVFWTDADSPKGRQLAAHPVAAMTVYWPALGRQVRIRGTVETSDRLTVREQTVYTLRATAVEFWQGDPERNHVRLRYSRGGAAWERTLLRP
jgi:pyridoxamine 5'-phosphate oxidase